MRIMILYSMIHEFNLLKIKGGAEAVALNYAKIFSDKNEVFYSHQIIKNLSNII